MKIYSEKTNKEYATVEECLKAEEAFDKAEAEKKAAKEKALIEKKAKEEKLVVERKAEAEKVEEARKAMITANKNYRDALAAFCSKYGSYHYTVKPGETLDDFWSSIWDNFWF